ncbi:acetyltransferase [Herbaspirillum sp. NPDC101397]|uniref:acetyltransferase n=1 Tax=Herbaspirillum sp. NPDC101397 TaxID=3364006 RepID=UPI00383B1CC2
MKPDLILIGAGGHSDACIDVIEQDGRYNIAGLVGCDGEVNQVRLGYTVIGTDDDLIKMSETIQYAFIVLGQIKSAEPRAHLYAKTKLLGFKMPVIVSPGAYVSPHAKIGAGTIVMHGAVVNAGARIGENCIINTRALVEHGAVIGDHCHISTGAIVNGDVCIGERTFIGSGSVVKQGLQVGEKCMIGMGVHLRHHLSDNSEFVG